VSDSLIKCDTNMNIGYLLHSKLRASKLRYKELVEESETREQEIEELRSQVRGTKDSFPVGSFQISEYILVRGHRDVGWFLFVVSNQCILPHSIGNVTACRMLLLTVTKRLK
jgi:hypothetical protein